MAKWKTQYSGTPPRVSSLNRHNDAIQQKCLGLVSSIPKVLYTYWDEYRQILQINNLNTQLRNNGEPRLSRRDFHQSIPGVARTPVSYTLWKPSTKKKWFLDHFNIDVVVIFDVVVRSPAHGILVTANIFFLALCACCHPGLAWEGLFVLHIDPPQQQASLL